MNRFMMILIFALCAALANASFVTQSLEERLLSIEERLAKVEAKAAPFNFQSDHGYYIQTPYVQQGNHYFAVPNQNGGK